MVYAYNYEFLNNPASTIGREKISTSGRILTFKGRLTDNQGNPVSGQSQVKFALYNDKESSGSALLWQEVNSVNADTDGFFTANLGNKEKIHQDIFSQNPALWLGVAVDGTNELKPRQEIATIGNAENSFMLNGLLPINAADNNAKNVVLTLNSSGNLEINDRNSHRFQAVNGEFILSGNQLTLTTVFGSNSNVVINPDGTGTIDIQKPIQNTSNNINLYGAVGAVEVNDTLAISATSSSQSAFIVNQNDIGPIISALNNGTAKFTVDSSGNIMAFGNISARNYLSGRTFLIGDESKYFITDISANLNNLNIASNLSIEGSINSNIIPLESEKFNLGTEKKYWNKLYVKNLYTLSEGTFGYWQRSAGTISPQNITDGINLGNTATSSALIHLAGTNNSNSWINNGNFGIGTTSPMVKLDVAGTIRIDSTTLALGNNNALCHTGTGGPKSDIGDCPSAPADIAENYATDGKVNIGDIVAIDSENNSGYPQIIKANKSYQSNLIGIISALPSQILGSNIPEENSPQPVALTGRTPVKVTLESGSIQAGDPITSSQMPGFGKKATNQGPIIAKALEEFNGTHQLSMLVKKFISELETEISKEKIGNTKENKEKLQKIIDTISNPLPEDQGWIMVYVQNSWNEPQSILSDSGNVNYPITAPDNFIIPDYYTFEDAISENIKNFASFYKLVAENISVGLIQAEKITTKSLVIASDNIIVNGSSLKEYILDTVNNAGIIQSNDESNEIITVEKLVSPISQNPKISLNLSENEILLKNASNSAIVRFDNTGNATFSGNLTSVALDTQNASISGLLTANQASFSGTLRATKIIADQIEGIASNSAQYITNNYYLATPSSSFYDEQAKILAENVTNLLNPDDKVNDFSYINSIKLGATSINEGLMVFGPASFSDISTSGQLAVGGKLILADNTINILGADLEIQPLRQGGVSFLSGLVKIDEGGNLNVMGSAEIAQNLKVKGKIISNLISPANGENLVIGLNSNEKESNFVINNSSSSAILSVNQFGDLIASGSASIAKLKLNLSTPAIALSDTEIIATGSAGVATITPYQSEITINNDLVTDRSLIYITPRSDTGNQTLYLLRQVPNVSFTVGVSKSLNKEIEFNWIIVN